MKKVLLVVIALLFINACGVVEYSSGTRSGVIQKASMKGFLFKTYEGELVTEGFKTKQSEPGKVGITNVWQFSIADKAVMRQALQSENKQVILTYRQVLFPGFWQADTEYLVTNVSIVE